MQLPETIQDLAKLIFEQFNVQYYSFKRPSCATVHALYSLANGDMQDCLFFNNAGEMPFDIWTGDSVKDVIKEYEKRYERHVYAYRLNKREVIKKYPVMKRGFLHWLEKEYWLDAIREE